MTAEKMSGVFMSKREEVRQALRHIHAPSPPHQLDLTKGVHERLVKRFGDENFLISFADNCLVREKYKNHCYAPDCTYYTDIFGVRWSLMGDGGDIGNITDFAFREPDIGLYKFDEPDLEVVRRGCKRLCADESRFRIYEIPFSLYERAWTLRGIENILTDMLLEESFVHSLLDKILEYDLKIIEEAARYPINAVMFGDDWGAQRGLIMGISHWRTFIKPRLKILYEAVRGHGLYVIQHSCGDNSQLFPDLIELGLDVYNTFQPEIYDIRRFKREYGNDLSVYGGISTQGVLAHGTPDQVYETVRQTISVMAEGGGYIAAPTHQLTYDISDENIDAFLEAVKL